MKILFILTITLSCFSVFSADTVEPFELGFSDFEYYTGVSDISNSNKNYSHEITIGAGITERFSSTFNVGVEKSGEVIGNFYSLGLFLNVFSSEHFDLDIYSDIDSEYCFTLGSELNFDLKDDLALAGLYIRSEVIYLNQINEYTILLGAYYTFLYNLQFLLEFDTAIPRDEDFNIGVLAFGINYGIIENIEIITEFALDIPQKDEEITYSFSLGFISTI